MRWQENAVCDVSALRRAKGRAALRAAAADPGVDANNVCKYKQLFSRFVR